MKMKGPLLMISLFFGLSTFIFSQSKLPEPWVSYPSPNVNNYGVFHFRKSFDLDSTPEKLLVHISADNRYRLFVNGKAVSYGPAKGDLRTYKYDVVDIAPYLQQGKNALAAWVYNGGKDKPLAFVTFQTAFLFRAEDEKFSFLNSDKGWKCYQNPAYDQITYSEMKVWEWVKGFYACGGGDEVFAERYPWGWESTDYKDNDWDTPVTLHFHGGAPWNLVPRNIAFMAQPIEKPKSIRRVTGMTAPTSMENFSIPANTKATVLFDFGIFTMGYPELKMNNGKGASVKLKYAEALYDAPNLKTHRDSVEGKTMYGVYDIYHADGGQNRLFRPLWKRAFRYLELVIETKDAPLEIVSLQNEYSGYPYPEMATFKSDDKRLDNIFEMCLQTLRMCSAETYYDTPFYEQLSYGGDNRPIAAISMYNSTDDRLFREVMRLYPQSKNIETKLFKSAYPSRFNFDMGTWSMAWIQSLHDYYLLRADSAWTKPFVQDIEGVLTYYEKHMDERMGLLSIIDNKNFVDWSIHYGNLPMNRVENNIATHSALLSLYFAHTLDCAITLYRHIGEAEKAAHWESLSNFIKSSVFVHCWDEEKQLVAEYPDKQLFTQHTNLLAILCDLVPPAQQNELLEQILTYDKFDEVASSYFQFFTFKAMEKLEREDLFLEHLDFWHFFIERGSTTCGETGFASHDRSDCHAWSAHPAYYFLRSVAGIKPAEIGFGKVKISPSLSGLQNLEASMPHPNGKISVKYSTKKGRMTALVNLPKGLSGTWEYQGVTQALVPGENTIKQSVE